MPSILTLPTLIVMTGLLAAQEPVRTQLARQQQQTGMTLVSFYGKVRTINFASRSYDEERIEVKNGPPNEGAVSRDGLQVAFELSVDQPYRKYLGIARSDGGGLQEYQDVVSPSSFSWSNDKSKLIVNAALRRQIHGELLIVTLDSKVIQEIEAGGYVTSQCWSPDDKEIVYGVGNSIRIYDVKERKWRELAIGEDPTWSPDGGWIAFRDKGAYYVVRPSGSERKLLFEQRDAKSGLWWSPDSSVVAYVRRGGEYPPGTKALDFGPRQLRVRRLTDNSDDWIVVEPDVAYVPSYQWVVAQQFRTRR